MIISDVRHACVGALGGGHIVLEPSVACLLRWTLPCLYIHLYVVRSGKGRGLITLNDLDCASLSLIETACWISEQSDQMYDDLS